MLIVTATTSAAPRSTSRAAAPADAIQFLANELLKLSEARLNQEDRQFFEGLAQSVARAVENESRSALARELSHHGVNVGRCAGWQAAAGHHIAAVMRGDRVETGLQFLWPHIPAPSERNGIRGRYLSPLP